MVWWQAHNKQAAELDGKQHYGALVLLGSWLARETWPGFILHVVLFSIYISALHSAGVGCRITTCTGGPRPGWHLDTHGGLASQQPYPMPQMPPIFISHHHVRTLPAHCSPPGPPRLPCEGGLTLLTLLTPSASPGPSSPYSRLCSFPGCFAGCLPAWATDRPLGKGKPRASGRQGAPGCQLTMLDAVIG